MSDEYRATDVLGLLSRMGESLSNLASGEKTTLESILGMVSGALPSAHALIIEFTDKGYRTAASIGVDKPPAEVLSTLMSRGLLSEMLRRSQPVFVRDLERDSRYGEKDVLIRGVDVRSVACLPVTMGDTMLKCFAAIFKNGTRRVDHLFRYGGEEFLALLPHIPKENAKIYAERIRRTTSETLHTLTGLEEHVTVSIGIAAMPADGEISQEALEAADAALYRAKGEGRDRVVLF